jgi:hypothetical protein
MAGMVQRCQPAVPAADLVLVEAGAGFPGLEGFLDRPAAAGDTEHFAQRHLHRCR